MSTVHVIDHPMIQHKLTIMRKKETGSKDFRELLKEISLLMGYEITRDLPLDDIEIETPICRMTAKKVSGRKLAIVPILRAGIGMVDGLQTLVPVAKVGHIGLYRDEKTHIPVVLLLQASRGHKQAPRDRDRPDARHRRKFLRRIDDAEGARMLEHQTHVPRGRPGRNRPCAERAS